MNVSRCALYHCWQSVHSSACSGTAGVQADRPPLNNNSELRMPGGDRAEISAEARLLLKTRGSSADFAGVRFSDGRPAVSMPGESTGAPAAGEGNHEADLDGEHPGGDSHFSNSEGFDAHSFFEDDHNGLHEEDDDEDHALEKAGLKGAHELSLEEQKEMRSLQMRDRQVRAHEQAHVAASGRIPTSAPSYEYETGPDGRRYAVGGEVNFSVPAGRTPQEDRQLAQQLRRMALAPADPSPKDRAVAAEASAREARATREIMEEKMAEQRGGEEDAAPITPATEPALNNADEALAQMLLATTLGDGSFVL